MQVNAYAIGPARRPVLDRVCAIADQAAHLVENEMGVCLRGVEILVTDTYFTRLLACAEDGASLYGCTVYGLDRIIAIANAQAHLNDLAEVGKTVVHELVHAAQMLRPGVRRVEKFRTEESLSRLSAPALQQYHTRWDDSEAQACDLERLAAHLDPAAGPVREARHAPIRTIV
ncbi:hypothetical protein [Streptomyces ortus]|uniref:Uncharacterized protein n=1 Tax=Streptomyces ortus TaxID=2867268 RepID=A0ABT3V030_9ACTN|nr:hypothetical protein [Streptomyces ortus]MCX4231751.1 hypothetical protein [Streptomyces ortus]